MSRRLLCALVCGAALLVGAAQAQAPWPTDAFNPQPAAGDLVLPVPCGGAIAFRPIPTPLGQGALADRPATLGQSDPENDYAEYLRQSFLAGPFPGGANEPPRYYIAKYEVTRDQWAAVMSENCPALPTASGRVPQASMSWLDAVAFTTRLSTHLLKNAKDKLPRRDDALAGVSSRVGAVPVTSTRCSAVVWAWAVAHRVSRASARGLGRKRVGMGIGMGRSPRRVSMDRVKGFSGGRASSRRQRGA